MARPPKRPQEVRVDAQPGEVTVILSRTEALALEKVAGFGLKVTEALNLIPNTSTAEIALGKLRDAL
jgi:hypothetical protein